jgi:hypothetical protein
MLILGAYLRRACVSLRPFSSGGATLILPSARSAIALWKVFQAQFGFYDTVVAAPSQVAALRAWGIHQNLFAGGQGARHR